MNTRPEDKRKQCVATSMWLYYGSDVLEEKQAG